MRKYLELFKGSFDDSINEKTKLENKPYIAYSTKLGKVMYTVVPAKEEPVSSAYVTFKAEEANSTIGLENLSSYQTLEYSTDTTTWSNMDTSTTITLTNIDDEVYIRGVLSEEYNSRSNYTQFKMTGKIAASGNCNALWNYQDLNAPLKVWCGHKMFYNCASLTVAPELPSQSIYMYCYSYMFANCINLNTVTCLSVGGYDENTCATDHWLDNVSVTGTFIKAAGSYWPSYNMDSNYFGIPEGWTVVDAEL